MDIGIKSLRGTGAGKCECGAYGCHLRLLNLEITHGQMHPKLNYILCGITGQAIAQTEQEED
jgi:hypothetical protein